MQDQEKVTIVGAVYQTVNTNGDAFQRQVEQKQREEKRVEQAQRTQEMLQASQSAQDVVELSSAATERVQDDQPAENAPETESEPLPPRGNALDAIA